MNFLLIFVAFVVAGLVLIALNERLAKRLSRGEKTGISISAEALRTEIRVILLILMVVCVFAYASAYSYPGWVAWHSTHTDLSVGMSQFEIEARLRARARKVVCKYEPSEAAHMCSYKPSGLALISMQALMESLAPVTYYRVRLELDDQKKLKSWKSETDLD